MIHTKTMWGSLSRHLLLPLSEAFFIFGGWLKANHAELQPVATAITILAGHVQPSHK
jgi:hypothetical protein